MENHQADSIYPEPSGDPLHALQREVAFSAFESAHVGAVDADQLSEGLLGETTLQAVGAEVPPNRLLEIALCHTHHSQVALLEGLQTYE